MIAEPEVEAGEVNECFKLLIEGLLETNTRPIKQHRLPWATKNMYDEFVAQFNSKTNHVIVVKKEGQVAGYAIIFFPYFHQISGDYDLLVKHCYVKKEFRHTRVFWSICKSILDYAWEKSAEHICFFTVNPEVQKALKRCGFFDEQVLMSKKVRKYAAV